MLQHVEFSRISVCRTGIALGLALGLNTAGIQVLAQEAKTDGATSTSERLLVPSASEQPSATTDLLKTADELNEAEISASDPSKTPSFEELDSAASDLNEALSGARAKLDELRQATELAAMAAQLRDELESSIQENNRLAASLAEAQSDRSQLETDQASARREIFDLQQSVDSSKIEIEAQREMLDQRQARIDEIEAARIEAENQITTLEGGLDKAGSEIGELSEEIAELTGQLEATQTELADANERAQQARTARDEADSELSTVRKQIAGMLRSVLLGGEPIDVSALEEEEASQADEDRGTSASLGLGVRYEALRASNVRAAPSPEADRVGFAKRGDFVTVIGKVNGRNWFEVETIDGVRGFIFGDLIRPAA